MIWRPSTRVLPLRLAQQPLLLTLLSTGSRLRFPVAAVRDRVRISLRYYLPAAARRRIRRLVAGACGAAAV